MGMSSLPGGTPENEQRRKDWAASFVAACVAKGVSVVGITDHHDTALVPYIQEAAEWSETPVIVYPGIEVTCSDDAQSIIIVDPGQADLLKKLLLKLPGVLPADDDDETTCEIQPTTWTVAELHAAISDDSVLQESCLFFPHFGNEGEHKTLNKAGHQTRFASLLTDGVYTETPFDQLAPEALEKAYGKVVEWGDRRRAILVTGDSRSETFERLGHHKCWIKLGETSLEALRQALLADEARIAYEEPQEPLERVVELTVQSSLTGDTPVTITFNPGFNAIIGGRGSGKSAILEYLRFGLARTARDLDHETDRDREEQLIEDTLVDGFVQVIIEREGIREAWRRDLSRDQITIMPATGSPFHLSLADARRRFRGRAFFQKQLSTTTSNPQSAVEQITGIAAAEQLDKRREIDLAIDNAKRTVTTTLQQAVAHWHTIFERSWALTNVADLRARIVAIGERLKAEGVSEAHLAIIADEPRYARGRSLLTALNALVATENEKLSMARRQALFFPIDDYPEAKSFSELERLIEQTGAARSGIQEKLIEAMAVVHDLNGSIQDAQDIFAKREEEYRKKLAEAIEFQTKHKALLDENARLNEELKTAEHQLARLSAKLAESAGTEQSFTDAREQLKVLVADRRRVLSEAADEVAGKSSALLKARLKKDPSPIEYCEAMNAVMDRAAVHDAAERCTAWIKRMLQDDPDDAWEDVCNGLIEIYKAKIETGEPNEPDDALAELLRGFLAIDGNITPRQLSKIYANIGDSTVGAMLSAVPHDYIAMTYVDAGRDMAFAKASPGQQASALLELLLKQSAGTLIIDQPEDDLDNRVIMRIVELIRTSKSHRQLIFTTHNPNMVVNGDADKIIALKAGDPVVGNQPENPRIEIAEDGAIETPAVCDVITHVMEGGKDAFDLRSRKYRFDG
jgi:RecF/RecN/SMC family protein